jgi:hypothetical protein
MLCTRWKIWKFLRLFVQGRTVIRCLLVTLGITVAMFGWALLTMWCAVDAGRAAKFVAECSDSPWEL